MNLLVQIVFYFFAGITIISAAIVVFAKSLIRSAFGLLFTFLGVAVLYIYLSADFLAVTQIVIYIGGILILLLFGVMLTQRLYAFDKKSENYQFLPALLAVMAVFAILVLVMLKTEWFDGGQRPEVPTTAAIGMLFMKEYILPFEVASVFLLMALIGAAMIVRRKSE